MTEGIKVRVVYLKLDFSFYKYKDSNMTVGNSENVNKLF